MVFATLLVAFSGITGDSARAITSETDVQFSVTQSPASPITLQAGSQVTFSVTGAVTLAGGYPGGLFFEFEYPAGLSFVSGVSSPAGVSCSNNVPAVSTVRCSYPAVIQGALVPLTLFFGVNSVVTTAASQVKMRAGTIVSEEEQGAR